MASVAGIGGLAKKVENIIGKVRQRVDKAIDKVLLKAKKLFKGKKGKGDKDKGGKFTEKERKAGLRYLHVEEKKHSKNNKITRENAIQSAKITKSKHPIFKSITVVDGGKNWNYGYTIQKVEDHSEHGLEQDGNDYSQIIAALPRNISRQTQERHIKDHPSWIQRGQGSYLLDTTDAQNVLDAVLSGNAEILGTNSQNMLVVRFNGVTGYNNNPGAGYINQETNIFVIKGGSRRVSIVPTNPLWSST